ncbi:MAG: IS1 family transposase [Dehalococcoidia bacterium]|nr:IS1 family transposase [Dehalococcoidia bacterium]
MNKLNIERQAQIIKVLCEGNSIRSTARITDTAINTVVKLLREVGKACLTYQDETMQDLRLNRIQVDEIWSFVYSKEKNIPASKRGEFGVGDVWTFTAIDADTKLVPCWLVGQRDAGHAFEFIDGLRQRLANRVQLTTDGHKMYLEAVEGAFGSEVDYAMLVKVYGAEPEGEVRYSPAKCLAAEKHPIQGNPNPAYISTSYVERQNLTMRMSMRRFTRLTNAFSKKLENHEYALALYFMHYNFARTHKSLGKPYPTTPAMAAGLTNHVWTVDEIVRILG